MAVNLVTTLRTREHVQVESRCFSTNLVLKTDINFWRALIFSACGTLKELGSDGSNKNRHVYKSQDRHNTASVEGASNSGEGLPLSIIPLQKYSRDLPTSVCLG